MFKRTASKRYGSCRVGITGGAWFVFTVSGLHGLWWALVGIFFRKSRWLSDNVGKHCTAGKPQMTIWRMRTACWILKATEHTESMQHVLLFHCKNGYTNASQCYVTCTVSVLLLVANNTNRATINCLDRHSIFALCFNNLLFP